MAEHNNSLIEINILGDDREALLLCPLPNRAVIGLLQADSFDVRRIGKQISNPLNNPMRNIPIQKKLHAGATKSFLSRSAANAKHA